jgi:phenylacetate-CoA ligase
VTDLDNLAMPFIRYNIGDIGLLGRETVSGSNNRKLEKLSGRVNDTIKLPNGKVAPGLTFYYISRSILESSNVLKEFIIRQTALDTFVFEIVSERELNDSEIRGIQEKMDLYLETGLNLEIRRVSEIQRPPSGKIKHFYSELD